MSVRLVVRRRACGALGQVDAKMSSKKTKNQKDSSRDSEKSHSVDSISVGKKSIGNKIGDFWRQYILRK